jgi:hypothetical protein
MKYVLGHTRLWPDNFPLFVQTSPSASFLADGSPLNACSRSWEQDVRLQGPDEEARQHPGNRSAGWRGLRKLLLPPLLIVALLSGFQLCEAVTPLSGWYIGRATNYGGPFDGKNPSDPSWGTSEVGSHYA